MTPEEHRVYDRARRLWYADTPQDPAIAHFYPTFGSQPPTAQAPYLHKARLQLAQEDQLGRLQRSPILNTMEEHHRRLRAHTDQAIRQALLDAGQDPDVWEDIARRRAAGEFDPPAPTVRIVP